MSDTAAAAVAAIIGTMMPAHCSNLFSRSQSLNISAEQLMMANDCVAGDSDLPTCECLHTGDGHVTTWPAEQTAGHWLFTLPSLSRHSPSFRPRQIVVR